MGRCETGLECLGYPERGYPMLYWGSLATIANDDRVASKMRITMA